MYNLAKELYEFMIKNAPQLFSAMLLFIGFYILGRVIEKIIHSFFSTQHLNQAIIRLLGIATKNLLLVLGLITSLGTLALMYLRWLLDLA